LEQGFNSQKICPYVQNPSEACYCFDMNSLNTDSTIYYCGGHYLECEIFKKCRGTKSEVAEDPSVRRDL
jgi:hypothetical protein